MSSCLGYLLHFMPEGDADEFGKGWVTEIPPLLNLTLE